MRGRGVESVFTHYFYISEFTSGHVGPKLGKTQRAAPSGVPFFDVSPFGQEGDWSALTYTGKGRFSMVQAVTYQSDKQSVYFQGKLIVLENLTPVLSPEEKKKRKKRIEKYPYVY